MLEEDLKNLKNGIKIMGKKKKTIPSSNKAADTAKEAAIIITVRGQPDHIIV